MTAFMDNLIFILLLIWLLLSYLYHVDEEFAKWVRKCIRLWKHRMFAALLCTQSIFVQAKPVA